MKDELEQMIAALQPAGFVARTAAIDLLERHAPQLSPRAQLSLQRWEEQNERVLQRLQRRIREGRYTRAGLLHAFTRCAAPAPDARHYDALDLLFAGLIDAGELPEEQVPREAEMVAYQPTPSRAILGLLPHVAQDDVFYDLGSGLGRVVILVALLRGAHARGVELEPAFCEYAARCAARVGVRNAEFIQADAREAELSDGTVFFLYTPFRGALLQQVLARLQLLAAVRTLRVCTFGPCTLEVARSAWLQPLGAADDPNTLAVFQSL